MARRISKNTDLKSRPAEVAAHKIITMIPKRNLSATALDAGYTVEFDSVQGQRWHELLEQFDDSTLYQTWSYGVVMYGRRKMGHMTLLHDGQVVAASQVRFARLPLLNIGIAYLLRGPVWRLRGAAPDEQVFQQALRALRNEYVCKRGLLLRISPLIFTSDPGAERLQQILAKEGYSPATRARNLRTILMDLSPPLETMRCGLSGDWKRNLKAAEKRQLTIVEGKDDELFATVIDIYNEMVSRKRFYARTDIPKYQRVQELLPDALKMKVSVCNSSDGACAGLVWSEIGDAAIELFAATRHTALKNGAAYSLRWRLVEHLRQGGFRKYNLNGINPERNPGCYHFKSGLAGKTGSEVSYLGAFESRGNLLSDYCVRVGEEIRVIYDRIRARKRTGRLIVED